MIVLGTTWGFYSLQFLLLRTKVYKLSHASPRQPTQGPESEVRDHNVQTDAGQHPSSLAGEEVKWSFDSRLIGHGNISVHRRDLHLLLCFPCGLSLPRLNFPMWWFWDVIGPWRCVHVIRGFMSFPPEWASEPSQDWAVVKPLASGPSFCSVCLLCFPSPLGREQHEALTRDWADSVPYLGLSGSTLNKLKLFSV